LSRTVSAATPAVSHRPRLSGGAALIVVWPIVMGVAMVVVGLLVKPALQFRLTQWLIAGLLALSLGLVWGIGRMFSFGQTLFFGIGAYTYAVVTRNASQGADTVPAVIAGVALGTLVAAALGYFMFYGGITDVYVAVVTLAATLVAFTLMGATGGAQWKVGEALLGGYNGMPAIAPLTIGGYPIVGGDFLNTVIVVCVIVFLLAKAFIRSNVGRVAIGVGVNEQRAELLGFDTRRYKLLLFSIGGAIASLAGTLFSPNEGIVTPGVFGLALAGPVVIWVMLGGRTVLSGAIVGALVLNYLSANIDRLQVGGATPFANQTTLILGIVLLIIVFTIPEGIVPALTRLKDAGLSRGRARSVAAEEVGDRIGQLPDLPAYSRWREMRDGPELEAKNLVKHFDGVRAVNGVSLTLEATDLMCLLGPNGAGKSTVFNILAGRYQPTSGDVLIAGKSVTKLRPHERARRGLGLKLQVPTIFTELSVRENLWIAGFAGVGNRSGADRSSEELLDWLGLRDRADTLAGTLSHGQQQTLEIAMVLATGPSLVLLDEPTAGMTHGETTRVAALAQLLHEQAAVLVIEHDMDFVRALNCPVVLLVDGEVFARGAWDELRRDKRVLDIYLGRA
jgi:branched-chain amino acid transport system permease protein